jgi:hypothetical protein
MNWLIYILLQAAPDSLGSSATNAIVTAGPVAILLAIGVIYFALRERKREAKDDAGDVLEAERFKQMIVALQENTAALVEGRAAMTACKEIQQETRRLLEDVREELERRPS